MRVVFFVHFCFFCLFFLFCQRLSSFALILSRLQISVLHMLAGSHTVEQRSWISRRLSLSSSLFDVSVESGRKPGRQPCPSASSIKQWAGWQREDDGQQRRGRCFAGTDTCSRPRGMSLLGRQRIM